jgi:hypothetical protein
MTDPFTSHPAAGNLRSAAASASRFASGRAGVRLPSPFAAGGSIAAPAGFPLQAGSPVNLVPPAPVAPESGSSPPAAAPPSPAASPGAVRRSETQWAAMIARAVGQGQRNL